MPGLFVRASPDPVLRGRYVAVPPEGLVLSRRKGEGLFVSDSGIAHGHARFDLTVYGLVVTDGGTGLGTWANGALVQQVRLSPGDEVQAGSTVFVVQEGPPMPPRRPAAGRAGKPQKGFRWGACCLTVLAFLLLVGGGGAFFVSRLGLPWARARLGLEPASVPATPAAETAPTPEQARVPETAAEPPASPAATPVPQAPADFVSREVAPGDEPRTAELGEGVKVTLLPGALDAPATLTIRRVPDAPEAGWVAMKRGDAYDVAVGERKRFDKPLLIDLALDRALLPGGEDPARSVVAAYFDEKSKAWVVAPSAVDAVRGRVVARTRHLCLWTIFYKAKGWETLASRNFNIVYKPSDAIVYLGLKKGGVLPAGAFVKLLADWLDTAYETYERQGFTVPGTALVPVDVHPVRLELAKVPVWAFVGSATAHLGGTVSESQWSPFTGNILFASNFKDPAMARHEASHELFHAVQNEYFNLGGMSARRWWMEATADYAAARLAMGVTGKASLMGAEIKPRYLEKCLSFSISGDTGKDPHSFHDYSTSHFVDYLVDRGAPFKAMWDAVAAPWLWDYLQVLDPVDKHLKAKFGEQRGLAAFYTDFARFYLFDPASPLPLGSGETLRDKAAARADALGPGQSISYRFDLEPSFTAKLWSIRPEGTTDRPSREVKLTAVRRDAGVGLFVYSLPGGRRLKGGGGSEGELGSSPRTVSLGKDEQLFVLAIRTGEGSKAAAEVKVEDLATPEVKKLPPPKGSKLRMDVQLLLYVSYTDGFKDDRQVWPRSGFQPFENRAEWRCFLIGEGGSFSGQRMDGDPDSRVEGRRTADRIVELKWKNHLVSKSGGVVYRDETWDIELKDIPVNPMDPREYQLEGYDLETGKYREGFEKHVPKLEHKITFKPSGKTIELFNIFWTKTEARSMKSLDGFGLLANRPFVRVYIYNPDDYK